jgi:hypothetical protein
LTKQLPRAKKNAKVVDAAARWHVHQRRKGAVEVWN